MTESFVIATWAALYFSRAVHVAFSRQTIKLAPVMKKLRQGIVPVLFVIAGFAPLSQAHSMPGQNHAGSGVADVPAGFVMQRDGISLDEAVARAERQYRARVVRTDVQDEDGRKVYVLKMLSENGRVFTVRIDASTGGSR